jgi:hypothetical protein
MARREIEFSIDEHLARRLAGRASCLGQDLSQVIEQELMGWLGDWGLDFATYIVQPDDTLHLVAEHFYGDAEKAGVIAAFNAIPDPDVIHVGQELRIPEAGPSEPLPRGESPYLFGLHDRGGEHYMAWAGRKGWVLCTEELGADPDDWGSKAYTDLADDGFGVMVRLNHGYGEKGTLPPSSSYDDFAKRCGNFVEQSTGCHIWIIGNEPNLAVERPGGARQGEVIIPEKYAAAFRACREEVRARPGHADDQVVTAAIGPWNIQTTYEANPSGDWIVYFQDMLEALDGELDGVALHTYGRDADPAHIVSEARMEPPFDHRRKMFRTYIDFMEAIPQALRYLPVYITETDQNIAWVDVNSGWIQEAYAEINRWNGDVTHQRIRSLILYRWERYAGDVWHIRGKRGVINDFREVLQHEYRWYR